LSQAIFALAFDEIPQKPDHACDQADDAENYAHSFHNLPIASHLYLETCEKLRELTHAVMPDLIWHLDPGSVSGVTLGDCHVVEFLRFAQDKPHNDS